jgi:hypothetical protein
MYNLKEYARLSMLIKRHQEKGLDVSNLLEERKRITKINVTNNNKDVTNNNNMLSNVINNNNISDNYDNMLLITNSNNNNDVTNNDSNILALLVDFKKDVSELIKTSFLSLKEDLTKSLKENLIKYLNNKLSSINSFPSSPPIGKEKEILEPIKRESAVEFRQQIPKEKSEVSLFIERDLMEKVRDFCENNRDLFPHASVLITSAFLAYKKGELTLDRDAYTYVTKEPNVSSKKNMKLDVELRSIYDSLAKDRKIIGSNQIISAYLKTHDN